MRIEVTQEDIDNGTLCGVRSCPVVLAIRRASGLVYNVTSGYARVPGTYEQIEMPSEASVFVDDFDHERPVAPFTFDLPI